MAVARRGKHRDWDRIRVGRVVAHNVGHHFADSGNFKSHRLAKPWLLGMFLFDIVRLFCSHGLDVGTQARAIDSQRSCGRRRRSLLRVSTTHNIACCKYAKV